MVKIFIILLWSICAIGMNLGAKKMTMDLVVNEGVMRLLLSALRSYWFYLFISGAISSGVLYLWLLKLMPLSIAGSIASGLGIVLIVLTGAVFCKENVLELRHIAGIILIIAGVIILQNSVK